MPSINFCSTEKHVNAKSIWSNQDPTCIKQKAFPIPEYTLESHTMPRNQGPKGTFQGYVMGKEHWTDSRDQRAGPGSPTNLLCNQQQAT